MHIPCTQDALKPTLRRDWNCPWVKRDGRGLKKVMKSFGVEAPAVHPVATSKQHFYRSGKFSNSQERHKETKSEATTVLQLDPVEF